MKAMKKEKIAVLLYTILACIVAFISIQLTNFFSLLILVLGVYFATVIPVAKKVNVDSLIKWILSNTFLVYILVWFLIYTLLSNV